ncbi:predicted protein [Botrytis cinerea T4]|uniref:Uncharacterized protein n=1 Tax=Botryotinia fuckeliana (strain T4) TaxID=999810 RepID=G2YYE2_BOTF4|nr:predicted protein [Botrytis cinerea T4]
MNFLRQEGNLATCRRLVFEPRFEVLSKNPDIGALMQELDLEDLHPEDSEDCRDKQDSSSNDQMQELFE